jgi:hypothetical protein
MAQGLFTLRQQVQGIVQKAWIAPAGTSAGVFNGTSQYLTVPYSSAFNFGTGDFTIEGWINLSSLSVNYYVLAGTWTTGTSDEWLIQIQNNNTIRFLTTAGTSFYSATITTGVWYHIAGVRSGSTITLYVNGASVGSYTNANSIGSVSKTVYIGAQETAIWYVNGYISNFRIVKGTALYTSNFAIPSAPLRNITGTSLLTLQNATIVDNSSNASTITNVGSVTTSTISPTAIPVNGLSPPAVDYLVVAGGGGGGYIGGGGGAGGLLQGSVPVAAGSAITVTVGSGGAGGTGGAAGASGTNSVFGAISSTGGGGGGANSSASPGLSGGSGGGASASSGYLVGGVSGQGIVGQGNAGGLSYGGTNYTGGGGGGAGTVGLNGNVNAAGNGGAGIASAINGTVTTYSGGGAGPADTNGTGGSGGVGGGGAGGISRGATGGSGTVNGVTGSTNTGGGGGGYGVSGTGGAGGSGIVILSYPDIYAGAAATTGSPTVSTSGSGSISFNRSDQYLSTSATQIIPSTGDFTVEAWIYPTAFTGNPVFCGQGSAGDADRTLFFISTGGVPTFTNGPSFTLASTGTVSLNAWTYIAFTRSGSTGTWYINGSAAGTGSLSGISIQNTILTIGGSNPAWTVQYFGGYISNFRISTVAKTITSTPIAPFDSSIANTKMLLSTVSGAYLADASSNSYTFTNNGTAPWNQLSPFATGLGYKNRVYTFTSSGTVTLTF